MKQICSVITWLLVGMATFAQSPGRVRISFAGFQCNEETWDNALQTDGKRDEVYIRFDFSHADKNGSLKYNYHFTTPTYGDINGFNGRVKAGSAGSTGGVRTGDVFQTSHVIGEYDVAGDDIVTLSPAIWEWDNMDIGMQTEMDMAMDNNLQQLHTKALHSVSTMIPGIAGAASFIITSRAFNLPEFANLISNVLGREGNRPIGITTDGKFNASILVLNTKLMQQVAYSNYGYGMGIVPVEYNERKLGNSRDHGAYTLFIKIEFMPQSVTAAQPAGGNSPGTAAVPAGNPPSQQEQSFITDIKPETKERIPINPAAPAKEIDGRSRVPNKTPQELNRPVKVNFNMVGKWTGAWGDPGHLNNYYSFVLNTDGSMLLYDANGQETGNGTYEFKDMNFTARYKSKSNGTIYALSGTFNLNEYSLSGSWQKELIKVNTGEWSVKKQ